MGNFNIYIYISYSHGNMHEHGGNLAFVNQMQFFIYRVYPWWGRCSLHFGKRARSHMPYTYETQHENTLNLNMCSSTVTSPHTDLAFRFLTARRVNFAWRPGPPAKHTQLWHEQLSRQSKYSCYKFGWLFAFWAGRRCQFFFENTGSVVTIVKLLNTFAFPPGRGRPLQMF